MIKLSDIIKSGGGNAKINRFINRYVLSKQEKKDIVEAIKENGNNNSNNQSPYEYYEYITIDDIDLMNYLENIINIQGFELFEMECICAYNSYNSSNQGGFKALLYGNPKHIVPNLDNTSPGANTKVFGYKFCPYIVMTEGDGIASSYFITTDLINNILNAQNIKLKNIGDNAKITIFTFLLSKFTNDGFTEDEVRQKIKFIEDKIEFKRITEKEYYEDCYNKAKEYYDSLKQYE